MLTTTALFVELLVIGMGTLSWLVLLAGACFGYGWLLRAGEMPLLLPPALALTYILGSIIDRLADRLFASLDDRFQRRFFGSREGYIDAMTWISEHSEPVRRGLEYSKSRIRVCRGWAVNAGLMTPAAYFSALRLPVAAAPTQAIAWFVTAGCIALTIGSFLAWQSLSRSRYQRLGAYYERMSKEEGA